jgi:PIN domain nuclease of toxin-antitoxin system
MSATKSSVNYSWLEDRKYYLLDSCTFLWAVANASKLGAEARRLIEDTENVLYVSAASAYEIGYKGQLGKLGDYKVIASNFEAVLHKLGARELSISLKHALHAGSINSKHRDPFDRIIASQSVLEQIPVLTSDKLLSSIDGVKALW